MLSRSEASQRLSAIEIPDWAAQRQRAVARLGGEAGRIAGSIVEPGLRGADRTTAVAIDGLRPRKRRKLFETLAPGMGEATVRGWDHLLQLPYQHRLDRRPFRAPGNPQLSWERRLWWLSRLSDVAWRYGEHSIEWYATWAAYLDRASSAVGLLLAAEIDQGPEADAVFAALVASARGEHAIGAMGRHVVTALLGASRVAGWELIENMLIAAQRQEGLRQVILETVDESHPEAFVRMLRLIVDQGLTRFASVIRAFDVWFGLQFDVGRRATVDRLLSIVAESLGDPDAAAKHLGGADPEAAYAALWSMAWRDVAGAIRPAAELMTHPDPATRFAATHLVGQLDLAPCQPLLLARLEDEDERVSWRAFEALTRRSLALEAPDALDRLDAYLQRLPEKKNLEPLLWEWSEAVADPDAVLAAMVVQSGDGDALRLAPYVDRMSARVRGAFVHRLAQGPITPSAKTVLLGLTGDRSELVRRIAFEALAELPVTAEDAPQLEALLTRKTAGLRRAVIALLAGQPDEAALASARRLLDAGNKLMREAGLDLMRELVEAGRQAEAVRAVLAEAQQEGALAAEAAHVVAAIADDDAEPPTLDDGLGLFDPEQRTAPPILRPHGLTTTDPTLPDLIEAAEGLVVRHRDLPIRRNPEVATDTVLYGDMPRLHSADLVAEDGSSVLRLWLDWWHDEGRSVARSAATLSLACLAVTPRNAREERLERWETDLMSAVFPAPMHLEYTGHVAAGLQAVWLNELTPADVAPLLDAVESTLARVPSSVRNQGLVRRTFARWVAEAWDWRTTPAFAWVRLARMAFARRPDAWDSSSVNRMWCLLRWLDEPSAEMPRRKPELAEVIAAYRHGAASDADMIDHLLTPSGGRHTSRWSFRDLSEVTRRRPRELVTSTPGLSELVSRIAERVVEVELGRGEMTTAASMPALALRSVEGAELLVRLIGTLGRRSFTRGWSWDAAATNSVLSHLVRVCLPAEHDTPAHFAELARGAGLSERRLIEIAVYAPQWARYVEHALGWEGLEDAVHWLHAHTKDSNWTVDKDIRELWSAEVARRTPLTAAELTSGAVDVAWYRRVRATLGDERWAKLDKMAKYASGGGGHKRAQLYATALSGELDEEALRTRIEEKRHQDSVRALGLLPLPGGEPARTQTVLERYEAIQEFVRGSRQFGAQRRASERGAADTGLDNLARTAGYRDPQRLQWAMETAAVADLAAGPVVVVRDPYVIELSIDELGAAHVTAANGEKRLKSIPAKVRKDDEIARLRERKTALTRQAARMRRSLEEAMIRGDAFETGELAALYDHPVLRPMLARLLWIDREGVTGYLADRAVALRRPDGTIGPVTGPLRLAHPHDLLTAGWASWQHECFVAERVQPFKQVFRELYVLTAAERSEGTLSRRYAGHQVNPRQAMALLGGRNWVAHPEDGPARTYHEAGITARLGIAGGWFTPAEVEGMTLEWIAFTQRDEWKPMPLDDVPPRLFSETMRDLDLVVSVAHVGGVDPEASTSTIEMRKALVEETTGLLGMDNVSLSSHHVVIDGDLGSYSVHLGSGVVHQRPGGAVCIIPVHAQHRGRLFLPFADDDPKTAEVVSKVVLLASDKQIEDPTILEQLVR